MPQAVVASSSTHWRVGGYTNYHHHQQTCMEVEMLSLSLRISWRFLVPRMFLRVV